MNILTLCDRYPFPMCEGLVLRLVHFVKVLNKRHSFDLVCYKENSVSEEVKTLFHTVDIFNKPELQPASGLTRLCDAFSADKLYLKSPDVIKHLERIIQERQYDLIWDSGGNMLMNLPSNAAKLPLLVDNVDDLVLHLLREVKVVKNPLQAVIMLKRLLVAYRFEQRYLGSADYCSFVSKTDADMFSRISPRTPAGVISNGVDSEYFRPLGTTQNSLNIVFEGAMSFTPNIDGVLYFVSCILPRIHSEISDVKFTIVGRDPAPAVRMLTSKSLEVTGYVDDVRPYLDQAALFVCPLRKGAGIKNKILQAWAMEKAVVATRASIGGLNVREGKNILIRDNPKEFAKAVLELIRDPKKAKTLGMNGRETVVRHYAWDTKALEMEEVMKNLVKQKK